MTPWHPYSALETELKNLDERLAVTPDDIELRFDRAVTLTALGRKEDAKAAYLELITLSPTHFGALNNLGALLYDMGFKTAAQTAYTEAVKHHPDNPAGHVNLANALARNNETEKAIEHFRAALAIDPGHAEAHQGLAYLFSGLGDEENARLHRIKGFKDRPLMILPYRGKDIPIAVLLLASPVGGTVPIRHHLDDQLFFTTILFVDFYNHTLPFPPHQAVFNAIGDADICSPALETAAKILQRTNAPVINPPSAVLTTGRAANAKRFASLSGVITPKIAVFPRSSLTTSLLTAQGFAFPLLLRSPGFHTGKYFVRVESARDLAAAVAQLPGEELMVIEYLDTRSADGKIRKYRVMMIDGEFYPVHAAVSNDWKVHYFSADMAENPDHRAEDERFLYHMPEVLGPRAMQTLVAIHKALGLDYAGADFSLNHNGEILLFEANATMFVNVPDADVRFEYRRVPMQCILDAIRQMILRRVTPGVLATVSAA